MPPLRPASPIVTPSLVLRPLKVADYSAVQAIFRAVFPAKYNLEFGDVWTSRNPTMSLGAFVGTELAGFLVVKKQGPRQQRIEFLGVNPQCQKGGVGTLLLQTVLDTCLKTGDRATLIPVNDPRIIHWYKKHGFRNCGEPFVNPYTGEEEQLMERVAATKLIQ
jgi:ribosomal protein S18 acetylase RimI-like enzyme